MMYLLGFLLAVLTATVMALCWRQADDESATLERRMKDVTNLSWWSDVELELARSDAAEATATLRCWPDDRRYPDAQLIRDWDCYRCQLDAEHNRRFPLARSRPWLAQVPGRERMN